MSNLENVREFAIKWHGTQKYGEIFPYWVHLDQVHDIAVSFDLNETIQTACYLHDILEDTECEFTYLWRMFGWEVAQLVFLVTDEKGQNRKERKEKTYLKTRTNSDAILLKLCDRIANVEASKYGSTKRDKDLFHMYKFEHTQFLEGLCISGTRYGLLGEMIEKLNKLFEI